MERTWLSQVMTGSPRSFRMIINHLEVGESRIMVWYWRRQWQPTRVLLPGKSHGYRSLVACSPWGREESDMTERRHFHFSLSCIGEGNGNPLRCSYLENPRDGGAWWTAISGSHRVGHDWSDLAAAAATGNIIWVWSSKKAGILNKAKAWFCFCAPPPI